MPFFVRPYAEQRALSYLEDTVMLIKARVLPVFFAFFIFLFSFVSLTEASSPSRQVLETTIQQCLSMLADPAYNNPATREKQRDKIETLVRTVFDFEEFSARTVGQRWNSFTALQKHDFSEAFAGLLLATYLGQLDTYNGEQVRYVSERSNESGSKVEQRTELTMKDGKVIPVAYRMLLKNNKWVVYDVVVEGVSLVKNYRTQFQDLLATDSPENLIKRIRSKTAERNK